MFRDLKDGKGKTETTKLDEVVNPAKMLTLPDFIHASLMLWFDNHLHLFRKPDTGLIRTERTALTLLIKNRKPLIYN